MKCAILLFCLMLFLGTTVAASAQTTVFAYQGRLWDGGQPANGHYDLQFRVADAVTDGNYLEPTLVVAPVTASNGLFTVALDFGGRIFDGSARWLEISVRTNGSTGNYTLLSPRQPLTATPYAIFAGAANVAGSASNLVSGGSILATMDSTNVTYSYWTSSGLQLLVTGSSSNTMNGLWVSNTFYLTEGFRWPAYTNAACPGCVLWNDYEGVTGANGWVATNAHGIIEYCFPPDYANPVGPFDYINDGWAYSDLTAFEPAMNSWYASNTASSFLFSSGSPGTVTVLPTLAGAFAGDMSGGTNLTGSNIRAHTVPANALINYSLSSTNLNDAIYVPVLAGNLDAATNINRYGWTHFTGKLYSNATLRILIVGNGFAFPPFNMLDFFVPRLEAAGGLVDNGRLIQQASAIQNAQFGYGYRSVWYRDDALLLTNGASHADYGMNSVNVRGVFYVVTNLGGSFKLQSFTGGTWQDVSGPLSSYSANSSYVTNCMITNQLGVTSETLRVQALSGSNIILCASSFNTFTNGVIWGKYATYSSSLLDMMTPPINYLAPLFTNWAPDLILVKEDFPSATYEPYFEGFSQFVTTNCPNTDIVWCGLHPAGLLPPGNGNYPGILQMEIAIRQLCVKYKMSYFDAWSALGGQQVWAGRGWDIGDGVHPSATGTAAYDALLWAWLSPFSRAR